MATATASVAPETGAGPMQDEPEGLYEVIDGRVLEKAEMGAFEAWIASALFRSLVTTPEVVDRGRVATELLFRLSSDPKLDRRPDLAFVSFDRWPRDRQVPRAASWEVVPDLAVEVVSPNNKTADDLRAVEDYFRAGSRLVWLVVPSVSRVYAFDSPTSVAVRSIGDVLDAPAVLPGFSLPLLDLFGDPAP